ncbi:hypothetical protein D3C87_1598260 [compost metagenome]
MPISAAGWMPAMPLAPPDQDEPSSRIKRTSSPNANVTSTKYTPFKRRMIAPSASATSAVSATPASVDGRKLQPSVLAANTEP